VPLQKNCNCHTNLFAIIKSLLMIRIPIFLLIFV